MNNHWLWAPGLLLALLCLGWTPAAWAETVHLNTGESIKGKIIRVDDQTISIESDKGFGVLQIKRSDITLIEFDENERDPSRMIGIGYVHRGTPSSIGSQAAEYGTDALSLKVWLSSRDSMDLLVGFYSASEGKTKLLEVFSLDLRYAKVFSRRANLDLYWGLSAGYLNVTDRTNGQNFSDTGNTYRLFVGTELFFATLPNLGFSAEIGAGTQTVGDRDITNLSTTTFPTFALRYYY